MMKKIVSLFSLALLAVSAWAQTPVTLDFTSNDEWGLPTEYTVNEASFTAGGYTITIAGSEGNGYKPAVLYVQAAPAEEEGITTLSEANALDDAENFTFEGNAVVTICWNGSVYVRDESGYGQIAGYDGTFENGQVLSPGWSATKTSNNGWVKFIDAEGLSASGETNAELAAAQKLTGAVDESMLNAYVYVENVSKGFVPVRAITLPDGTSISLTGTGNQPASGNYNIYGIIWKSGDELVFEPVAWEKYVEPPTFLRGDVNKDGDVNIADVTALIDYLLSGDATPVNLDACDCNLDTAVNIADVTALIDFLLGNQWPNS